MGIKVVECLDWPARNRPGELSKFAVEFKRAGLNLDGLWAYDSPHGRSKMAAIAKRPAALRAALKRMGVKARVSRCFYVTGKDVAGAHVALLGALAASRINIETMDGLSVGGKYAATLWVSDRDFAKARRILKAR
jgi:hypothetical protein